MGKCIEKAKLIMYEKYGNIFTCQTCDLARTSRGALLARDIRVYQKKSCPRR